MLKKVFFKPWIGENYENGGIFGKKVLVLGDSHYCGFECKARDNCGIHGNTTPKEMLDRGCATFTEETIESYLDPDCDRDRWMNTFKKFERALSGNLNTSFEESNKIWNSLAFYNFIQTAYKMEARDSYTGEDYQASLPLFYEVRDVLKPDIVVVWGNGVWEALPSNNWEWINTNNKAIAAGRYKDSSTIYVSIYHPSSTYFSYDNYLSFLKEFL